MGKICAVTGKKPITGNKRSKALNATKRRWNINLQKATIMTNSGPKTIKVTSRGLRTLRKQGKLA